MISSPSTQNQVVGAEKGTSKRRKTVRRHKLGSGAYGSVHKVERDGVMVAVKTCKFDNAAVLDKYSTDQGKVHTVPQALLREAAVLQELHHENIISLLNVSSSPDAMEFVFELMEKDLKAFLSKCVLEEQEVWHLSRQLFSGLAFMHRFGILHRDLKPQNILLSNINGGAPLLKIADFGLSRFVTEPVTNYSSDMVTLWYRAPEILLQARVYGTEIDVWSAGCIICEMVTGKPLLPAADVETEFALILSTLGPPPLSALRLMRALPGNKLLDDMDSLDPQLPMLEQIVDLPRSGLNLVKWCLEYIPEDRCTAQQALSHVVFAAKEK